MSLGLAGHWGLLARERVRAQEVGFWPPLGKGAQKDQTLTPMPPSLALHPSVPHPTLLPSPLCLHCGGRVVGQSGLTAGGRNRACRHPEEGACSWPLGKGLCPPPLTPGSPSQPRARPQLIGQLGPAGPGEGWMWEQTDQQGAAPSLSIIVSDRFFQSF